MGKRLGHFVIVYLDTNVFLWLGQGNLERISSRAKGFLNEADLRISPMVLLELEYLFEINRMIVTSRDLFLKVSHEMEVRLCDLPFAEIVSTAVHEKWTRDPFDRMIVSNAKANGLSLLISADEQIQDYSNTVW